MGEILGVGVTHYPPLLGPPEAYSHVLRRVRKSHLVEPSMREPASWPEAMQAEWADEIALAYAHRDRLKQAFAEVRRAIDEFRPDAVIVFGDDQYENFKEDIIPPFNVFCMDTFHARPFLRPDNIWNAAPEASFAWPGAGRIARELTDALISRDFPVPYAYRNRHNERGLAHAFANAIVYLDWAQSGWTYPLIPISVNCYGRGVIWPRGAMSQRFDERADTEKDPYLDFPGPSGPTPRSCFTLGETLRDALEARPERFVVMASSGWSHAFLTGKHAWLYPDREFDRARATELEAGEQHVWANLTNDAIYDAGCQEFKNWICLSGVLPDRRPQIVDYLETWIFNSQKCFALFH